MSAKKRHEYKLTKAKYLLDGEFEALLRKIKALEDTHPRDALLLLTAIHTGARAQEILNIRPSDLDASDQSLHIRGLKNSDDRDIPIPAWLFVRLYAHARRPLPKNATVFDITYPRLDQIWKQHRPFKKKFHALRHTFAVHLYKRTKDLKLVRRILGHRDFQNTMIYLDFTYSPEETRRLLVVSETV